MKYEAEAIAAALDAFERETGVKVLMIGMTWEQVAEHMRQLEHRTYRVITSSDATDANDPAGDLHIQYGMRSVRIEVEPAA